MHYLGRGEMQFPNAGSESDSHEGGSLTGPAQTSPPTAAPLRNWAGNHTFTAARIRHPASIDEARDMVARARLIRALGSRHSFNGIADSEGDLIDLSGIDPGITIDPARRTVTVGASTRYGTLAAELQASGYALHNLGSLPHISIAGAIATGTHGSGDRNGNLATAVSGLQVITAGGDLARIGRGDPDFNGMIVGLGAFGIVARITLDIQPTFNVRQDAFVGLSWDRLLSDFDAVTSAAYSVSIMTKWSTETAGRLWLKTRLVNGLPAEVSAAHLGAVPGPAHLIRENGYDPTNQRSVFGGIPGPWSIRLPHARFECEPNDNEQIQSEYMVPRPQAVAAITALRNMAARIDPLLIGTEIRTVAADDLWLSPSYGHDCVALHFTWKMQPDPVCAITREIEDVLLPLGGRPHWGKLLHAPACRLTPLYPMMSAFRSLAARYDPDGKFRNAFLAKHVFA
jgi:alditol oxidase